MMDHRIDQELSEKTQIFWIQMFTESIQLEIQCSSDTTLTLNSQESMDSYFGSTAFQLPAQYSRVR